MEGARGKGVWERGRGGAVGRGLGKAGDREDGKGGPGERDGRTRVGDAEGEDRGHGANVEVDGPPQILE